MIASRRKNGVSPSETVEDRAAKDFRNMVRSRESRTNQKKPNRLMYVASAVLVLVAVIMGVSTLNNFGKMKSVQKAIEQAKAGNDATKEMPEVQETNGAVTEVSAEIEKSDGAEIPEEVLAPTVEAELEDETENETEDVQEKMTEKDEDGSMWWSKEIHWQLSAEKHMEMFPM